ncbi:hypothetical protein [Lysobacter sp. P5_B9]
MAQNLISLSWTAEQLQQFDAALATAEDVCARLISLEPDQVRGLFKMGDKSEAFCRETLGVLGQNRKIVPESLELDEVLVDLAALDALRPRLRRLQQLAKRAEDTEILLGSDIFSAALEGYALLKVSGKNHGLEDLRKGLSARFGRTRKAAEPVPA